MTQFLNKLLELILALKEVVAGYMLARYHQQAQEAKKELEVIKDAKERKEKVEALSADELSELYNDLFK